MCSSFKHHVGLLIYLVISCRKLDFSQDVLGHFALRAETVVLFFFKALFQHQIEAEVSVCECCWGFLALFIVVCWGRCYKPKETLILFLCQLL